MSPELFILAALAVYRLTFMLNAENGPADIFGRLRTRIGIKYDEYSNPYGTNWIAEGILCFFCLSVWVSFGLTGLVLLALALERADLATWGLFPFALSGLAIFLKKWTG